MSKKLCEVCGKVICRERRKVLPDTRTCAKCSGVEKDTADRLPPDDATADEQRRSAFDGNAPWN
jgi:RNA polymerase-binding transcription factor DksA